MFQNFVSFFKPETSKPGDNCNVNMWSYGDKASQPNQCCANLYKTKEFIYLLGSLGGRLDTMVHQDIGVNFNHMLASISVPDIERHSSRSGVQSSAEGPSAM